MTTLGARAAAAVLLVLAGCAGTSSPEPPDIEAEAMANPEVALVHSLDRVASATATLRAAAEAPRSAGAVVPAELQKPIVWRWSGPLDQAAKALATKVGYAYADGSPDTPIAMPTVSVDVSGATVLDVLRSVGAQAGDRATLVVDPDRRIVQVRRNV